MIGKSTSILLVDTDKEFATDMSRILKENGHSVLAARDGAHAVSILQFRAFDILVIDVSCSFVDGLDVIDWASSACPKPRIAAVGNGMVQVKESTILARGAGVFFRKPVNPAKMLEFIKPSASRSTFSGTVDQVDIIDYMQFNILGGRTTVIEITSGLGTQGLIYLKEGQVIHAQCGVLKGEQALYRCLCFRDGTFKHLPWKDPGSVTILKSGEFILMEAVCKRDEVWAVCNRDDDSD